MKASMKAILTLALAVGLVTSLVSGQAEAVPTCGTTINLPTGNGSEPMSSLGAGVCVQAQDKLFGNFTFGNLSPGGSVDFSLSILGAQDVHQIAFSTTFNAGVTYTGFGFEVAVNPAGPGSPVITALDADFTQTQGGPSTLTKNATPPGAGNPIVETKVGTIVTACSSPLPGGVCGETYPVSPGTKDIVVAESLVDAGTISSVTNTVVEFVPARAPEPASLLLVGAGLAGLGLICRRRKP